MTEEPVVPSPTQDFENVIQQLEDEVEGVFKFRDYFFENHPVEMASEKIKLLKEKVAKMSEKFSLLEETDVHITLRAKYLYIKGRCYNVLPEYDPRALECFSKAVKLKPDMIEAWNELGECYWKNMNLVESQACLESSLKRKRHRVTLRNLSILLRQLAPGMAAKESATVLRSVEYAKEAVTLDPKDGISWSVLGNAYLCQFFAVSQQPATLKLAMGAYKQAWSDAVARGTSDLAYNKGVAHNYDENYAEAMECFEIAHRLEPSWPPPVQQMQRAAQYLQHVDDIVHTKGRIKTKRLQNMVQSMDKKLYGEYLPGKQCTIMKRQVTLERLLLSDMPDGASEGKVVLGRVVGSYLSENTVPFTFAMVDESNACVAVNVYNWANGRGVIVGDSVCIPEPVASTHAQEKMFPDVVELNEFINGNTKDGKSKKSNRMYNFRTIRVNNPLRMLINGKRPANIQYAETKVKTTLEAY